MSLKLTKFDAAEYINTPERARAYLEMALEEDAGDGSDFRTALNRTGTEHERRCKGIRARPGRSDQDAVG